MSVTPQKCLAAVDQFGSTGFEDGVDAAADAIIRIEDETGYMTVHAEFDPIANPLPIGQSTMDARPRSIVYDGTDFFVGAFTSYPFASGSAVVYRIGLDGSVQEWQTGLTTVVDLAIDPRDGSLIALQHGEHEGSFLPETGMVLRLHGGTDADTLITGLTTPTAMAFDTDGSLYITTQNIHLATQQGQLLYYEADATGTDTEAEPSLPQTFALDQNYPNPFSIGTRVPFTLQASQHVHLAVYDVLGRELAVLTNKRWSAGSHAVEWTAENVPSGVYFFRLETAEGTHTRQGILLR